jgi:hypothetical protein
MLQLYGVDVLCVYPVPKVSFLKRSILHFDPDISLIFGIWRWHWLIRTSMLPGLKIYRVQGTDAYTLTSSTKFVLSQLYKRGTPILYAAKHLENVVGLPGETLPTPINTKLFKDFGLSRAIDILYYCPKDRGVPRAHTYQLERFRQYQREHPNETTTILWGDTPYAEMPQIYNNHKKYLRWTTHDANPKMPMEAFLCGCEVWVNDKPIRKVPDEMRMEYSIPCWIDYFTRQLKSARS